MVNAITLSWLSFRSLYVPSLEEDKAYGWDEKIGQLDAVAVGCVVRVAVAALCAHSRLQILRMGVCGRGLELHRLRICYAR